MIPNIQDYFKQFYGMLPYFEITESQWTFIKDSYDKEEVRLELAKCLMTYEIPYADITEKKAYQDYMKLKGFKHHELLKEGEWFPRKASESRYPYTYEGKQLFFTRNNTGNSASNFFQQANRWSVDGSVSPGPERTWKTEKFMVSLMGAAYSLKLPKLGKSQIRTMIGLRKYICAQFKPNVAKVLYDMYEAETVLDFSMGWGDRLAGFFASDATKHYIGLDPRKENHPFYNQQAEFYTKHNGFFETEKTYEFHQSPAEDFDFTPYENSVDVVFTSPPYFSVERYSYDDNQSWVRYKTIEDWNTNFLHKSLGNMIPTLKTGGMMCINIADVYQSSKGGKNWQEITNPMNDFLKSQGMTFVGTLGMEMAKRPNSGGAGTASDTEQYSEEAIADSESKKDQRFCEPMWCWRKDF